MKRIALFPGSFDPITNGHIDIIKRASPIFDQLIVAIGINPDKPSLFSVEERIQMIKEIAKSYPNVKVDKFSGLTVDYAKREVASVIVRGLRYFSDFEYEFQMAFMNRKLMPEVDTIFMMASEGYSALSSSLIRQVAQMGGNLESLVPPLVAKMLKEKFKK